MKVQGYEVPEGILATIEAWMKDCGRSFTAGDLQAVAKEQAKAECRGGSFIEQDLSALDLLEAWALETNVEPLTGKDARKTSGRSRRRSTTCEISCAELVGLGAR